MTLSTKQSEHVRTRRLICMSEPGFGAGPDVTRVKEEEIGTLLFITVLKNSLAVHVWC